MSQTLEATSASALEIIERIEVPATDVVASQFAEGALQRLVDLDTTLREASEPLPVISVGLHFVSRTARLPKVWIGYGQTEPEQGLRPVTEKRGPTEERYGLAVPLLDGSRGSATFHPDPHEEEGVDVVGSWWQQWLKTAFVNHVPGSEPVLHKLDDDADTLGNDLVATWLSAEAPYTFSPPTFGDSQEDEARIQTHEYGYQVESDFIAIGGTVVQAGLRDLRALQPREADVMRPLYDMLGTIAQILEVEA